jgi:light-independent protochlorophyllide reductase B subunit
MTNTLSKAVQHDSLSGIVAAFEGISDAFTMLNGPIGCKHHLSYTTNLLGSYTPSKEPVLFKDFYFGQARLPCTFVDEQDFIYGTEYKIVQSIKMLDSQGYGLIGVVNHSGTALIGDDLCRIIQAAGVKTRTMVVESSGFTGTFADGFKTGAVKILERLAKKPKETLPNSVNLIGPTVFHYNWKNDVAEIKRTLRALGVNVVAVICAGEKISNLERAGEAALNLVLYEEYADFVATFLEKEYGTPSIGLNSPSPFGLGPSEAWFNAVADHFKLSHRSLDVTSKKVRLNCYQELSKTSGVYNTLRGVPIAIFGDSSQVFPLMTFLYEYLGLYPVIVGLKEVGPKNYAALKQYINLHSLDTSMLLNPDQYEITDCITERMPAIVFGSNTEEKLSSLLAEPPEFIPVSFPYNERTLLTMRPLVGFRGVLTLVEDTLNSFRHYYSCRKNLFP